MSKIAEARKITKLHVRQLPLLQYLHHTPSESLSIYPNWWRGYFETSGQCQINFDSV